MSVELSRNLLCISLRNGVEIWAELEKAQMLQDILVKITQSKFVTFDGQLFNTADIVGIFKAATMADVTRRKNGAWQCQNAKWHEKSEECNCLSKSERSLIDRRLEAIKQCGKCMNGFIIRDEGVSKCVCLAEIERSV